MNKLKAVIISIIYDYIYIPIYFKIVYFRDWKKIKAIFGEFEKMNKADLKKYCLNFKGKTANVTGLLIGEIVKIVLDLKLEPEKVLLDGDNKTAVNQVREKFNFKKAAIVTVGKEGEFDYIWDFENDCPQNMPRDFDLIISQAMFEHLINPFKHLEDLSKLLIRGGGI